jgi:hypothetical protein
MKVQKSSLYETDKSLKNVIYSDSPDIFRGFAIFIFMIISSL